MSTLRVGMVGWNMQEMWILIFLVFPSTVFAGVDFSMMGQQGMPEFNNVREAMDWVKQVKWTEEYREQLQKKKEEVLHEVGTLGDVKFGSPQVREIMNRWEIYAVALRMMDDYKSMGVKGASFYAGSEPQ